MGFLVKNVWVVFVEVWVDFGSVFFAFLMTLTYVNAGICLSCAKCLINCLYELWDWISWLMLWWLLYEIVGCIPSCHHVLKHVALKLIKSKSFWHSIKIIVILFWNCKCPWQIWVSRNAWFLINYRKIVLGWIFCGTLYTYKGMFHYRFELIG